MTKIRYTETNFRVESRKIINQANAIILSYEQQGFKLTLRQLFYQFVARDLLANTTQNYKKLGGVINDGRLAGLIDWEMLEDRTRGIESLSTWSSPTEIVETCARQFKIDKWGTQPCRIEVWIEKEALAGVFERICNELRVPYLSCRGYTSQSEMWRASMRLQQYVKNGQEIHILHFGDHDPSGIDMSRDIVDRLRIFGVYVDFNRLALNMDQVEQYGPPPNPAKMTDTRVQAYLDAYGDESWELDALDPTVLSNLVRSAVEGLMDQALWDEATEEEDEHRRLLGEVARKWDKLTGDL